jgi:hypothetical protein
VRRATILTCAALLRVDEHAFWAPVHEEFIKILLQAAEDFEAVVVSVEAARVVLCWNAFTPYPFHEVRACHCAIHIAATVDELLRAHDIVSNIFTDQGDVAIAQPYLEGSSCVGVGGSSFSRGRAGGAQVHCGCGSDSPLLPTISGPQLDDVGRGFPYCVAVTTGNVLVGAAGTTRTVRLFVDGFSVTAGAQLAALGLQLLCRVVLAEGTFAMARSQIACFPIDIVLIDGEQFLLFEVIGKASEVRDAALVHRGFAGLCSRSYVEASEAFSEFLGRTSSQDVQVRRLLLLVHALASGTLPVTEGSPYCRQGPTWTVFPWEAVAGELLADSSNAATTAVTALENSQVLDRSTNSDVSSHKHRIRLEGS